MLNAMSHSEHLVNLRNRAKAAPAAPGFSRLHYGAVLVSPCSRRLHPNRPLVSPANGRSCSKRVSFCLVAGPAGTVLAHWSSASRATRYRVFQQIDGVDAMPVNVLTTSESDATLTGLPSGKLVKIYIIAANDAGQAQPCDTVTIVVP
jgi:hypothetical protein